MQRTRPWPLVKATVARRIFSVLASLSATMGAWKTSLRALIALARAVASFAVFCLPFRASAATPARLPLHRTRQSPTDLELGGFLAGVPRGQTRFVSFADLARLSAGDLHRHRRRRPRQLCPHHRPAARKTSRPPRCRSGRDHGGQRSALTPMPLITPSLTSTSITRCWS